MHRDTPRCSRDDRPVTVTVARLGRSGRLPARFPRPATEARSVAPVCLPTMPGPATQLSALYGPFVSPLELPAPFGHQRRVDLGMLRPDAPEVPMHRPDVHPQSGRDLGIRRRRRPDNERQRYPVLAGRESAQHGQQVGQVMRLLPFLGAINVINDQSDRLRSLGRRAPRCPGHTGTARPAVWDTNRRVPHPR